MIKVYKTKNTWLAAFTFLFVAFVFTFQGCKKKVPELATTLFKATHNKVFLEVTPEGFSAAFKKELVAEKSNITQKAFIYSYYNRNNYQPELLLRHLLNNDLKKVDEYYQDAWMHGLNAEMFEEPQLRDLVNKFHTKNGIKTVDQAYEAMARLELTTANSLINYSNDLLYGVLDPKKIFERYYVATKQADSVSMSKVFHIKNMAAYLDSIQPKSPQYLALQKAYISGVDAAGKSKEETKLILLVNMERLRWRNKPYQDKYVIVNIPDFTLDVVDSGHSVLQMKVCVGQGRNMENANTLLAYNDTCKEDKPAEHETPLLNSLIHSVDVNPIWNIPSSIAKKETMVEAANDRYFLANKGINVYKNGKLVANPEAINWAKVDKNNSPYEFKQRPGASNSLRKIKFLFNNQSSVYLHDTPAKGPFSRKMRAVSHGCIRLGDPQKLALSLFGDGKKYKLISTDMTLDNPSPTTVWLPKKVPVYITYVTCWSDQDGQLQIRNDVYGHDIVIYDHLLRYLHPKMN